MVRHGDEIVGMRGLYGTLWRLRAGTDQVVIPHADDLIIHPDHRNRGLFLVLHQATVTAAETLGFPAILSLSGGATTQQLSLVCGYVALGDLNRLCQPMVTPSPLRRIRGHAVRQLRANGLFSPTVARGVMASGVWRGVGNARNSHIDISPEADHPAMGLLASQAPGRSGSVHSEAFLRWRLANPDRSYRFVYWRDSHLRGYLVLAWDPVKPHRFLIADHAVEDPAVLAELLDALGRRDDIEFVVMSTAETDSQARSAAFVPDPDQSVESRRRFLFFPIGHATALGDLGPGDNDQGGLGLPAGWNISLLDTMAS